MSSLPCAELVLSTLWFVAYTLGSRKIMSPCLVIAQRHLRELPRTKSKTRADGGMHTTGNDAWNVAFGSPCGLNKSNKSIQPPGGRTAPYYPISSRKGTPSSTTSAAVVTFPRSCPPTQSACELELGLEYGLSVSCRRYGGAYHLG